MTHTGAVGLAAVLLLAGELSSACAAGTRQTADAGDAAFRSRDRALLETFAAAAGDCAPDWPDASGCRERLQRLAADERRLFDDVRAHRFSDITEANYWHRGRLKFPSAIAQALERTDGPTGTTRPPD